MDERKQRALEEKGWAFGNAADLLELKPEEAALVEVRTDLAQAVRRFREEAQISQASLATLIGSTQPKVSDMEHGKGSLEAMMRALLAMGADRAELARAVGALR